MNKIILSYLICVLNSIPIDPGRDYKGARPHTNLWRIHTFKTIKHLETGLWIIGFICLAMTLIFLINLVITYTISKKKVSQYRVENNILHNDERTNSQRDTYI